MVKKKSKAREMPRDDMAEQESTRGTAGNGDDARGKQTPPDAPDKKDKKDKTSQFPVVGIGASAGGLQAIEELLGDMPGDTGGAFVVITHQHPDHTSMLPELLGRCTDMPVNEAVDGTRLEPDHVYVCPPGRYLAVMDGVLYLMEGPEREIPPLPVDYFFRSLAQDQRGRAICIILSGTGMDGTLGLQAVKGESGLVMAQDVQSARYAGMPSSAVGSGLVDYVLAPAAMAAQLGTFMKRMVRHGPPLGGGEKVDGHEQPLQKIFVMIRSRTGHDFSAYKPTTVRRRIERRMMVHQLERPDDYVRYLQENPFEIDILFRELLIGVTSFFRDPEAFEQLAEVYLPELMASRPDGYTIRVWIPACGSGEEAYTIAILLRECADRAVKSFDFQLFGTDLDATAMEKARSGVYPAGIAADVPAEFLDRYFSEADGTYRIRKDIREMLVFAPQSVIKDPPFTRLDLVCCRNLLIYLNADLQRRLFPLFHYALKPGGLLLLGPSESIGDFGHLFETLDKHWKIYQRKEGAPVESLPEFPASPAREPAGSTGTPPAARPARPESITAQLDKLLLSRFAPATAVVNERGDIVYIHGRTGAYLEPPAGHPSTNIHAMAREGMKIELSAAFREALWSGREITRKGVRVAGREDDEDNTYVDITVARASEPQALRGLLLVSFRPSAPPEPVEPVEDADPGAPVPASRVAFLERELQHTKESLQATVEELETSNEELKSMNEEMQSTNEELQSSNEELETSKEEMQSLNEELTTVNAELQAKVEDLSHANEEMQNLLDSTGVPTIFVDKALRVTRYTQGAREYINLIPSDVGRPFDDLATCLQYDRLSADARDVFDTLAEKEAEIDTEAGRRLLMRIAPHRTVNDTIQGAVITFVDISRTRDQETAQNNARELLQCVFDAFRHPALVLDANLRVLKANGTFCRTFTTNLKKTEGQLIYDVGGGEWDIARLRELLENIIPERTRVDDFEVSGVFPKIGERVFRLNGRRLQRETGLPGRILLTMEDATGDTVP